MTKFVFLLIIASLMLGRAQGQCPYNNALLPNGTCYQCGTWQFPYNGTCLDYLDKEDKISGDYAATIDTGNTAWMLAASALVMIMTPALGMFYGGLVGQSNVLNTMLMSLISIAVVSVSWALFGYSFAFGTGNGRFGMANWAALKHVGMLPSPVYGTNIPHLIYCAFQCMFAQITPALISGAVIGRMSFPSYCFYILVWSTVIYNCLSEWMWSMTLDDNGNVVPNGWLNSMGAIDFAGGSVIHISSGFSALSAAYVVGKRKYARNSPSNVPMVLEGAALLWFGWFGFNAGSAGAANGVACTAFINTHLATSACVLTWMVIETVHKGVQTPIGAATAMVVGLVCITPGCGFVTPMASLAFGIVPAFFCYAAIELKPYMGADDALDAFACHGIGGVVGCFLTGLFADSAINGVDGAFYGRPILLGYQTLAIVVAAGYSFFGTAAILFLMKYTIGIRVSGDVEISGLDRAHGYVADKVATELAESIAAMEFEHLDYISKIEYPTRLEAACVKIIEQLRLYKAYMPASLFAVKGSSEDTDEEADEDALGAALTVENCVPQTPTELMDSRSEVSAFSRASTKFEATPGMTSFGSTVSSAGGTVSVFSKKPITVLYVGIRGFHDAVNSFAPDSVLHIHSSFVQHVVDIAKETKGVPDTFQGDRVIVTYNAVHSNAQHRVMACRAALRMTQPAAKWMGQSSCAATAGVASAPSLCGNIGTATMKRFSVIGTNVNMAWLLCRLCETYRVQAMVPEAMRRDTEHHIVTRLMITRIQADRHSIHPIPIYEVVGERRTAGEEEWMYQVGTSEGANSHASYNRAVRALHDERYLEALELAERDNNAWTRIPRDAVHALMDFSRNGIPSPCLETVRMNVLA